MLYAAGVLPGVLFIAWVNRRLYGSPLASGYGSLPGLFSLSNVPVNIARYGRWLVESQTPLMLAGATAVLIPLRSVWKTAEARAGAVLLALAALVVWTMYVIYRPFEDWWYLRFLLASWPAMAVGVAALAARLADGWNGRARLIVWSGIAALGVYGVAYARTHGAFPSGEGDYRYAAIAALVEQSTPPSSVIITSQHAGPITYYSGRLTLRFDAMDPAWLDRTVDWLAAQGSPAIPPARRLGTATVRAAIQPAETRFNLSGIAPGRDLSRVPFDRRRVPLRSASSRRSDDADASRAATGRLRAADARTREFRSLKIGSRRAGRSPV